MSFRNPTAVKVGMTGVFSGVSYRVRGRVVMGVVDDGVTYYWNEFNLRADSGESATLVYETTESSSVWRWFTMFEPQFPIAAADAATKRVGDPINLDGTDVHVTLLDRSRVYFIEGEGPEGLKVGDKAQYFNAESGRNMIVVSWTGEEVECYHGVTVGSMTVSRAFNLSPTGLSEFTLSGTDTSQSSSWLTFIFGVLGAIIVFSIVAGYVWPARMVKVQKIPAPPADLTVGSVGKIEGTTYTILSDALVEVHEVNETVQRHEFHLLDEYGNHVLLIHGWKPGTKDWCLFTTVNASKPMTPPEAAAVSLGKIIVAEGTAAPVNHLFHSIVMRIDAGNFTQDTTGKSFYGFSAESGKTFLLARWDDNSVTFQKGSVLLENVTAAFHAAAK